jgi:hypothetical protein
VQKDRKSASNATGDDNTGIKRRKGGDMFEEKYFTEKDAIAVCGVLTVIFGYTRFDVQYQGIYGDLREKPKTAYWIKFKGKYRVFYINSMDSLEIALLELLDGEDEETAKSVLTLIHDIIEDAKTDETG